MFRGRFFPDTVYISVTSGFRCVDLRKFYIPYDAKDDGEIKPTQKGVALRLVEWTHNYVFCRQHHQHDLSVPGRCSTVLLYCTQMILFYSRCVSSLQKLLEICESELLLLDMSINVRKSHCLRIGPRFNVKCDHIVTSNGIELEWCDTVRYLGIYITSARTFSCTCNHVKQSAYRAFNSIFGKVGRIASDKVIV